MLEGTIIKGIGGFYYIETEEGVFECRARGIFRKNKIKPVVGDKVRISVTDKSNLKGSLDEILPRRNELIRPSVANVDIAVIIFAAISPNINCDMLDRFIILAKQQDLDVVICINKIDLDTEKKYMEIYEVYKKAGFDIFCISADKKTGLEKLRERLTGNISVFSGPSGVGKSSTINALVPGIKLNTGEISTKIERGKHTTRHAEIIKVWDNTYFVDSPGFTSLYLENIKADDLKFYINEFKEFENKCKFNGCSHTHEPGCAVKEAVGVKIDKGRYERYKAIYNELLEGEKR